MIHENMTSDEFLKEFNDEYLTTITFDECKELLGLVIAGMITHEQKHKEVLILLERLEYEFESYKRDVKEMVKGLI